MTEKIYDKDPHILEFTATVISCELAEGKLAGKVPEGTETYAVILDRTAFFPEERIFLWIKYIISPQALRLCRRRFCER